MEEGRGYVPPDLPYRYTPKMEGGKNMTLPGVKVMYPDGGLAVQRPAEFGTSVLIIGTAEDGPKNNPIVVQSLEKAEDIFGRFGEGTLIRGLYELLTATNASVDARAMRIGNGSLARLGIPEASGAVTLDFAGQDASGVADPTFSASGRVDQYIDALILDAKYEGARYNQFTLRIGMDNTVGSPNYGRQCVIIYNPFTGVESTFSYDYVNTSNTAVDVHTVTELVSAINADSNLNEYIVASTTDLTALYEVRLDGGAGASYVHPASGDYDWYSAGDIPASLREGSAIETLWNDDGTPKKVTLYLHHITTSPDQNSDGIPDAVVSPNPTYGVPSVIRVGPVGMTWSSNIPTAGNQMVSLDYVYDIATASGELLNVAGKDFSDLDYIPVNRNESQAPGSVTGNTVITYLGDEEDAGSEYRQYVTNGYVGTSSDGTTSVFTFAARLQPDIVSWYGGTVIVPSIEHDNKQGLQIPTRIYETISGVTSETRKNVTLGWSGGTATVTFTDSDDLPSVGTIITIDYVSVIGTMTEYNTRSSLELTRGSANDFENYFVAGNQIFFGGPHDTDIMLTYNHKRVYSIPGDVSIVDADIGKIEFTNPYRIPQIDAASGIRVGLNYTYRPEWISPSGTEAMAGGGNGVVMTNKELKDALTEGYTSIENYEVDIVVPMEAHLDSTIEDYSMETGVLYLQNAGFHTQLADVLDLMSRKVHETIGIIGVEPAESASPGDIANWVARLTVPNANDGMRGANFMPIFDSKWIIAIASEIGISMAKLGIAGTDYYTDGATTLAALIASLPPQKSVTNRYIGRAATGLRYRLSMNQMEDLADSRFTAFRLKSGTGVVVANDVTCAIRGSDYDMITTLRIVKLVVDIIRDIGDSYIGEPNTGYSRNDMSTSINAALRALTSTHNQVLRAYDFEVRSSAADQREGNVYIDLDLVPVFTTQYIHVTIRLKNTL